MSFINLVQKEGRDYEHRCDDWDQKSTILWDITLCRPLKVLFITIAVRTSDSPWLGPDCGFYGELQFDALLYALIKESL
jgi:hypothetical protein